MARKKLNQDILSLRNETVSGVMGEINQMKREDGSPVTGNFGQELWTFELINKKSGEIHNYWGDGGLKGSFKMAKVKPGMHIEIVHTGEKVIPDLGKVQTYDIFGIDE